MNYKICIKCGKKLLIKKFHKDSDCKDGFKTKCKKCHKKEFEGFITIVEKDNEVAIYQSNDIYLYSGILLFFRVKNRYYIEKFLIDFFKKHQRSENGFFFPDHIIEGIKKIDKELKANTNFFTYDYFENKYIIKLFKKYCKENVN